MKLVFAIKSLAVAGGAERVFVDVANGLHDRGHDVGIMTFEPADRDSFYAVNPGIARLNSGASAACKGDQLRALPRMRRSITSAGPDAVIGFMPSCYVPLGAALALSGIPFVASEHNVPARYASQPLHWLSMKTASFFCRRFTAVSEQMRQQYPPIVRRKMVVLPNPVSSVEGNLADVIGQGQRNGTIIAVGRLHEQKDHVTLIRAFAMVAKEFPGWGLRILGDGTERQRLEREIALHGLADRVHLPGTVRDISAEYGAAQFYVIPSRYESYGLATAEALAHGLPAVGFADCPGTNELIQDGINGILVEPRDRRVDQLADALRDLISRPDKRAELAVNARTTTLAYRLPAVLNRWEQMLRTVARQ